MARDHSLQISEGRFVIDGNLDVQSRFTVSGLHTEHSLEIARVEPHDTSTYTCTLLSSPPAHRSYQLAVFQPPVLLRDKSSPSNSLSAAQLGLTENAPQQNISLSPVSDSDYQTQLLGGGSFSDYLQSMTEIQLSLSD